MEFKITDIESKLNMLSNDLQVALWNNYCERCVHDEAKIYENGADFFEDILKKKTLFDLVSIVSFSEAYSPIDGYVMMENMGDHNWYGEDYLLASAETPTELMKLYPDNYEEFLGYCAEFTFRK